MVSGWFNDQDLLSLSAPVNQAQRVPYLIAFTLCSLVSCLAANAFLVVVPSRLSLLKKGGVNFAL